MSLEQFKQNILFEDRYLLIVNKMPDVAVEKISPTIITLEDLATQYLLEKNKKIFLGIIHRLDRPTSGIILFAKKPSSLKVMNAQFENKTIKKFYLALVTGLFTQANGSLNHFLQIDPLQKKAIISNNKNESNKEVRLKFKRLWEKENQTLLQIELLTGRYHQIRAQFAFLGHPILGDEKYGATKNSWKEMGIALHASEIHFEHPFSGEKMIVKSDWEYKCTPNLF